MRELETWARAMIQNVNNTSGQRWGSQQFKYLHLQQDAVVAVGEVVSSVEGLVKALDHARAIRLRKQDQKAGG